MADNSLTGKQRSIINHYFGKANFNVTKAAIMAGYSKKTAYSIGHEMLKKPEIKAEIERRFSEQAMEANEVLARLGEQARGEYSEYLMPDGTVDLESLLSDNKGHLIKSITPNKYGNKIEFYDGQSALTWIGKHYSMFTDKIDIKLRDELESILSHLESNLDSDTFEKVINALSTGS